MVPISLVTIGRAFHWMDRAATLAMLERIVTHDGGVALFHDAHPPVPENDWFKQVTKIADKYGRAEAAHVAERRAGGHRRYETFLFASAFKVLMAFSATIRQPDFIIDDIVGRAFSMSTCSPEKLGDPPPDEAFEADLRAALRGLVAGRRIHRGCRTCGAVGAAACHNT